MKPGATAWPSASIVFVAVPDSLPISAILPSLTPTSPRNAGIPEPSTTRPFLINRSYAIGFLLALGSAAARPVRQHLTTQFPRQSRAFPAWIGAEPCKRAHRAPARVYSSLLPPSGHAALPARPRSARVPVRIAVRGAASESDHGAVERHRNRARR